jgi:hypothetical protein
MQVNAFYLQQTPTLQSNGTAWTTINCTHLSNGLTKDSIKDLVVSRVFWAHTSCCSTAYNHHITHPYRYLAFVWACIAGSTMVVVFNVSAFGATRRGRRITVSWYEVGRAWWHPCNHITITAIGLEKGTLDGMFSVLEISTVDSVFTMSRSSLFFSYIMLPNGARNRTR